MGTPEPTATAPVASGAGVTPTEPNTGIGNKVKPEEATVAALLNRDSRQPRHAQIPCPCTSPNHPHKPTDSAGARTDSHRPIHPPQLTPPQLTAIASGDRHTGMQQSKG